MLRDFFSLFPAYAGVILTLEEAKEEMWAFPRICGGDPLKRRTLRKLGDFSPHMRG